jgi:AcrR family transcriptional regulator
MSTETAPKKQEVLRVAQRLFRENGFQATSIRDIADELGIKGGSLYSHISSKEALLWEIASDASDRFFVMIEPIVASDHVVTEKLRDIIRGHVGVITDDLDAAAVFSNEWRNLSPEHRDEFVERRDRYEAMVTEVVQEGVQQGYFGTPDARYATLILLSSLNWIYQWFKPDGRFTAEEVARMMSDFIFDGLKRRTV